MHFRISAIWYPIFLLIFVACKQKGVKIDNLPHEVLAYEHLPDLVKEVYENEVLTLDTFREVCICLECEKRCIINRPTIDKSFFDLLKKGFVYQFQIGKEFYYLKANKGSPFVFYRQFFFYPNTLNLDSTNYRESAYFRVTIPNKSSDVPKAENIRTQTIDVNRGSDSMVKNLQGNSHGLIKFEPFISFEDFKVERIIHEKQADIDFKSYDGANHFRTRLKEAYKADTANFAGHYTFVYWGCGTSCQSSLLIDRLTGRVFDAPNANLGYEFRIDSRMLVVNPPDKAGFYGDCFYCNPVIYVFDEQDKVFKEHTPI